MTTWTVHNTYRCSVFDVERNQRLNNVAAADDGTGVLTCHHTPVKLVDDEYVTYEVKCRSIVPVYGGEPWPQMLLCFGVEEQQ